ncbi:MAG: YceI family protein [Campylobacteraceae bacterium]
MATKFNVDKTHSSVGFSVRHMMISNVKGEFKDFSGSAEFDNNAFTALNADIVVKSIFTGEPKREAHLLSPDFFDEANFPILNFKMTSYKAGEMVGDLTIRGNKKSVKLSVDVNGVIENSGTKHLGFSLSGKISRKEFGLTWNGLIETGGAMVGDEVKLIIEVEAVEVK